MNVEIDLHINVHKEIPTGKKKGPESDMRGKL